MSIMDKVAGVGIEKMSNLEFRMMLVMFKVYDFFSGADKKIKDRLKGFGVMEGLTVIDYGCGPGRYTVPLSSLVGKKGKVYAVDIHEMAMDKIKKVIEKTNLKNVEPILTKGYSCPLPDETADMVCALDMFHMIREPVAFLKELHRLTKKDGELIIDDGHQERRSTREKITSSTLWNIIEERDSYLKCVPQQP